jgi:DNA-binding phage protein
LTPIKDRFNEQSDLLRIESAENRSAKQVLTTLEKDIKDQNQPEKSQQKQQHGVYLHHPPLNLEGGARGGATISATLHTDLEKSYVFLCKGKGWSSWLSSNQLFLLSQIVQKNPISERKSKYILVDAYKQNIPWGICYLNVREIKGQKGGGAGGLSYEVQVDSLPDELRQKHYELYTETLPVYPEKGHQITSDQAEKLVRRKAFDQKKALEAEQNSDKRAQFLFGLIQEIKSDPEVQKDSGKKRSTARRKKIQQVAEKNGMTENTLYTHLHDYEEEGIRGLYRKQRTDSGKRKVQISRKWDRHFGPLFGKNKCQQISDELEQYLRDLYASFNFGPKKMLQRSQGWLLKRSINELKQLGHQVTDPSHLVKFCTITRDRLHEDLMKPFKLIYMANNDAGEFRRKYEPSIIRHRDDIMPGYIMIGDIHPMDISVTRPDGTIAYPKAISWLDVATNRIYITFKLCEKGESVKPVDVVQSFVSVVKEWGPPILLYMDNGLEYCNSEMVNVVKQLSELMKKAIKMDTNIPPVIRAIVYNAQAKPIKPFFKQFEEQYCSGITGYTGGNRMQKQVQEIGKTPLTFKGDMDLFLEKMEILLQEYHHTPQDYGFLKGDTPMQRYQRHIENGWGRWEVDEKVLAMLLAKDEGFRKVGGKMKGCIAVDGLYYFNQEIANEYTGMKLRVKSLLNDPFRIFVFTPENKVFSVGLEVQQAYFDFNREGAKTSKLRKLAFKRAIRNRKKHCNILELTKESQEWFNLFNHTETTDNIVGEIEFSQEAQEMLKAFEESQRQEIDEKPLENLLEQDTLNNLEKMLNDITTESLKKSEERIRFNDMRAEEELEFIQTRQKDNGTNPYLTEDEYCSFFGVIDTNK